MDERKAQEMIRDAVRGSLTWLDELPSREKEILEKTEKEDHPLMITYNSAEGTLTGPAYRPSRKRNASRWLKPALACCAALVLAAGIWAGTRSGVLFTQGTPLDAVSQPEGTAEPEQEILPAAMTPRETQKDGAQPLDRIDITVDPDLLWNEEDGLFTEGENIDKSQMPFNNAVYRYACDRGVSGEGELVYRSESGVELLRDRISLRLSDLDDFALDMPQKCLLVEALDGAFAYPLFDDRSALSYPSILLRNSGNDCMWTRVADGVQNRMIEKYTDTHVLTLAWRPVRVYLNGEYWGIYNMRENLDGHTVCRYEQIPDELAEDVTILYISGWALQGSSKEYKELRKEMKSRDPANNPEDLAYLEQEVDIDSFLDWLAVEMYFGNSDIGNGIVYRLPGGKWKCLVRDLDYGLYMSSYDSPDSYLKEEGMGGGRGIDNTIFRKILAVDRYRDLFLTKLGNVYKALPTEVMQAELDECVAWIEPGMKDHLERWAPYNDRKIIAEVPVDPEQAWNYWEKRIARMKNTMEKRPGCLYEQVQKFFGLTDAEMAHYFE